MNLDRVRAVADAVLYEGYLLYPYRATSSKNQSRWQWGVLGPPGAAGAALGEEPSMSMQCLVKASADAEVGLRLRFLQLQRRQVERSVTVGEIGLFEPVDELQTSVQTWISWDEATAHEVELGPCQVADLGRGRHFAVTVPGGSETEPLADGGGATVGRLVRRRWPLTAEVLVSTTPVPPDLLRLSVEVTNSSPEPGDKHAAVRTSLIGAHLVLSCEGASFVSLLEPPEEYSGAAAVCEQRRCWPVLAGEPGATDAILASPIILYDYPEVAEQSAGGLFDSTEIDEILTLRVMTLTDEEKAAARATDPRAAEIIDRCDSMSTEELQALHGVLRDSHPDAVGIQPDRALPDRALPDLAEVPTFVELPSGSGASDVRNLDPPSFGGEDPWWDPAADASVQPETDTVQISGVLVSRGSLVRVVPTRRADAQDLFFSGQRARVTAVLSDVDGQVHIAVVLVDDPAAEMREWYGRYFYFAPEELEPLPPEPAVDTSDQREESRP